MGANVPVMRGGKVAYCLTVSVLSSQFDQVLKNARLPAHWVLAVFDPHGVVAARTHSPEKFVGGKAVPEVVRALLSEREEGVVETRTLEGIPSMVAYSRSSATRWSIGVGMPVEMFEAPLRHHFQQLVGIVSLLALIGVAGAWLFAKRTTAAIRSLIGPAAALGRGEPFAAPSAHLRETDEVAEAMSSAAVLLKQRTDELIRAKDAAESGNRAKSTFLAVMSHEIRTPLHAITGMAHLIRRSGVEPHQLDLLNRIDAASEHLIDIINDVLDFSKIEADKMVLEQAPLSICGLLDNVSSMIEQSAEAKGLDVAVEPCAVSGHVIGDLRRLRQALLNYANNAVKFTSKGTIELKSFIVEESDADALIRFEVRDTGIGISEEDKARIFAPFEQIDGSMTRQYSGTGLGLVITRKIAELMGGTAGVESQVGVGSTFWFTARLAKTKESLRTVKRAPDASPEHMLKRDYPDLRVLVADDDPDNRFISQHLLKAVWPIIDTAEDGVQAVERVTENAYDLILMDMRMPRMDGLEATRRIRGLPNGRNTIILALTANVFAEDRVKCMEAGMDGLIPKAMGTAEPFATILEVLSKSH
jgi:signal transduction histidine kinase/CheY-like chemotaxis protein